MIRKVSLYFVLPMAIIAAFLSFIGVEQIEYGNSYYTFLAGVGNTFEKWKLVIPDIPRLNSIGGGDYDKGGLILQVLIKIANFFVTIVNALIVLLNFIISILNVFIQVVQFILSLIYECRNFINRFRLGIVIATM